MIKFYDTSALLLKKEELKNTQVPFAMSSISLEEIEDENYISFLISNDDICRIVTHTLYNEDLMDYAQMPEINSNDLKIITDAHFFDSKFATDEVVFCTGKPINVYYANLVFGTDSIEFVAETKDEYEGAKAVILSDEDIADFY